MEFALSCKRIKDTATFWSNLSDHRVTAKKTTDGNLWEVFDSDGKKLFHAGRFADVKLVVSSILRELAYADSGVVADDDIPF
ncbi:MAG TPA: hypothetical protein PLU80_07300 [Acidobacteriota bacterium]|nr:hypothetical protein [Acidobacteriota bacterium]